MFTKYGFNKDDNGNWVRQITQKTGTVIINGQVQSQGATKTLNIKLTQLPDMIIDDTIHKLGFKISFNDEEQIDAYVDSADELIKDYFSR